jgi:hypothetical protein
MSCYDVASIIMALMCGVSRYCGKACQRRHWEVGGAAPHRTHCPRDAHTYVFNTPGSNCNASPA